MIIVITKNNNLKSRIRVQKTDRIIGIGMEDEE
jgi:hypothetical protein